MSAAAADSHSGTIRPAIRRMLAGPPEFAGATGARILILLNILVFGGELAHARTLRAAFAVPPETVLAFGGNYPPFVFGEWRFETLLTSCFLHWSLLHIGFNLYALRQVGPFVERSVGLARFLPMYLVSGALGSLSSALWGWITHEPSRISAGASGAICGVIGTAAILGVRVKGWRGPIVRAMALWLAATVALGMLIHADNAAHLGGAAAGAVFAAMWQRGIVYTPARQRVLVGACAVAVVACAAIVAARDTLDPFATLDLDTRIAVGESFVAQGDCPAAIETADRALRIGRFSPRAQLLRARVIERCRKSAPDGA